MHDSFEVGCQNTEFKNKLKCWNLWRCNWKIPTKESQLCDWKILVWNASPSGRGCFNKSTIVYSDDENNSAAHMHHQLISWSGKQGMHADHINNSTLKNLQHHHFWPTTAWFSKPRPGCCMLIRRVACHWPHIAVPVTFQICQTCRWTKPTTYPCFSTLAIALSSGLQCKGNLLPRTLKEQMP
jgi:hypothetical protein